MRLNKYLAGAGYCSRRAADRLIEAGRVCVDGREASLGTCVDEGQRVTVDGKEISPFVEPVLLLVYKPRGIVCTEQKKEKDNIIDYLGYDRRVTYVGRLDKDSEGLLVMTNAGDLINKMMRAGNNHEKEYIVTVDRPVTEAFLEKMRGGVPILDTVTLPCKAEKRSKYTFDIILTQGLNRQIRRMCEALGYRVTKLKRIRVMNLKIDGIPYGAYREATQEEMAELQRRVKTSSNAPAFQRGDKYGN